MSEEPKLYQCILSLFSLGSVCVSAIIIFGVFLILGIAYWQYQKSRKFHATTHIHSDEVSYKDLKDSYHAQIISPLKKRATGPAKDAPMRNTTPTIKMNSNECYEHSAPFNVHMVSNESYAQLEVKKNMYF